MAQAPTRGSCVPATVIVTAPQRQWPVIAGAAASRSAERFGPAVVGCMFEAPGFGVGQEATGAPAPPPACADTRKVGSFHAKWLSSPEPPQEMTSAILADHTRGLDAVKSL